MFADRALLQEQSMTLQAIRTHPHQHSHPHHQQSKREALDARARRRSLARLRCAYFAEASEVARRYHVSFDRLLRQMWDARSCNPRWRLSHVRHVSDLALAAACVDNAAQAWADLVEQHEHALIRRCRSHTDQIRATIHVRRMLSALRRESHRLCPHSLRVYHGIKPLRYWLLDVMRHGNFDHHRANDDDARMPMLVVNGLAEARLPRT